MSLINEYLYKNTLQRIASSPWSRERIPRAAPTPENEEKIEGLLCWGQVGDIPTGEPHTGTGFNTRDGNEEHFELSRESDQVRIENPSDPQDWVEVDRGKVLTIRKDTKPAPSNTAGAAPDFGDFSASPIELSSFKPLGTETKSARYRLHLNNGPASA